MDKFLIFSSRIPEYESRRAQIFFELLKWLSSEYEVHYLILQSLFVDKKTVAKIENLGAKAVYFNKIRATASFEDRLKKLFSGNYEIILFDSIYTAKYYLPFIYLFTPASKLIIDARNSQYLMELSFAQKSVSENKRISIMEKSKFARDKEIPIYNYFDMIILENTWQSKIIKAEIPSIAVSLMEGGLNFDALRRVNKKKTVSCDFKDVIELKAPDPVEDEAIVKNYNAKLKDCKKKYLLMLPDAAFHENFYERLLFCIESNASNGIAFPVSNEYVYKTSGRTSPSPEEGFNFSEYLKKHFIGNFAEWRLLSHMNEPAFLVKNEVIKKIGLLDINFKTLRYAVIDLCYRIQQAGYRIIINQEAFIYYKNKKIAVNNTKLYRHDQRFLIEKWGLRGKIFLDELFKSHGLQWTKSA